MSKYGPEKESKSEDGMISQAKYVHTTNTVPEFPNIIRQAFTSLTGTYSDLVDMHSQQVQERNSCCLPAMMLPWGAHCQSWFGFITHAFSPLSFLFFLTNCRSHDLKKGKQ